MGRADGPVGRADGRWPSGASRWQMAQWGEQMADGPVGRAGGWSAGPTSARRTHPRLLSRFSHFSVLSAHTMQVAVVVVVMVLVLADGGALGYNNGVGRTPPMGFNSW